MTTYMDVVERLRKTKDEWPFTEGGTDGWVPLCQDAADEIERLRKALASERAAEREACAKVAETVTDVIVESPIAGYARPHEPTKRHIAQAIRNRGEE